MMTVCLTTMTHKRQKNLCDYMPDDVDQNDILFKHEPIDETPLTLPTRTSTNIYRYPAAKKQEQGKSSQKKLKSTKN